MTRLNRCPACGSRLREPGAPEQTLAAKKRRDRAELVERVFGTHRKQATDRPDKPKARREGNNEC